MQYDSLILHATCVAVDRMGVVIIGPSGSGKSALALQLIALGATLVADDRTVISRTKEKVIASPPSSIAGFVEARGVGILPMAYVADVPVVLVVDLASAEIDRLPQKHTTTLLDLALPCLHKVDAPYFPAAVYAYLLGIRNETR